jgi:uncharacterized membrane protein YgcG
MIRAPYLSIVLAFATCILVSRTAQAKYVPPPAPSGHCLTTVGWLAPADIRKIDEEAEIARIQTGFVIDVLLAPSDEPIDEIASETFKAWKPGDPAKDNGILLVIQPNFPRGQRKARLSVGTGVESKITPAKGKELLRSVIGPLINDDSDQVRTAIASAVMQIAKTLGADESSVRPLDLELPPVDAGAAKAGDASIPSVAPAPTPSAPAASGPPEGPPEKPLGGGMALALGALIVIVLGGVVYRRTRLSAKVSKGSRPQS